MLGRARRVVVLAFLGLVLTGAVLFTAEASHVIMNRVFQVKLGLIALGLINVALFEVFTAPQGARAAAARAAAGGGAARRDDLDRGLDRGRDLRAEHRVFLIRCR